MVPGACIYDASGAVLRKGRSFVNDAGMREVVTKLAPQRAFSKLLKPFSTFSLSTPISSRSCFSHLL